MIAPRDVRRIEAVCTVFAACVLGAAFVVSDNLHGRAESIAWDRLLLGLRTLHPPPGEPAFDTHFPLGTAVVSAALHASGLPVVLTARLLCLVVAGVALWRLRQLVDDVSGRPFGAAAVALAVCVPAVTRGAVVVGEEAAYAALLLSAIRAARQGRFLAMTLGANAMVGFRLDAMTVVPVFAIWAWSTGRRSLAVGCFASTALHLGASWALTGDPFEWARLASVVTQRSAHGFGGGPGLWTLAGVMWDQLGPACVIAGAAAMVAGRPRPLFWVALWLLAVDTALAAIGAMEARAPRYVVVLLTLWLPGAIDVSRRLHWGVPVLLLATALHGLPEIARAAREERLPDGLIAMAPRLREAVGGGRLLVGEQHPVVVVAGGFRADAVSVLPPGAPADADAADVASAMREAAFLLQVDGNPPEAAIRAAVPGLQKTLTAPCCALWAPGAAR
jgi:hypothetical protein